VPAFSVGTSIKPRLTLGLGLTYVKKQMITFDVSFITGYVERKSNVINETEKYRLSNESLVVSKLETSWALSLGYIYAF
jgi:long-subunit fatty acid transport protein